MAMSAAKLSYDILLEKGRSAIRAARQHLRTPAYEDVVEATVLLSAWDLSAPASPLPTACRPGSMCCRQAAAARNRWDTARSSS